MTPIGQGGLSLLCLFHVIVSGMWLVAISCFHNRVSWFFSGALVFTHVSLGTPYCDGFSFPSHVVTLGLLVMTRVMATIQLRLLYRVRKEMGRKLSRALLPHAWPREAAMGLLVTAVLALPFLACYMAQIIYAKVRPTGSSDNVVRQLAEAMWVSEAAVPIIALVMIALTVVLHVADIVIASVVIYQSNHDVLPVDEAINVLNEEGSSDTE